MEALAVVSAVLELLRQWGDVRQILALQGDVDNAAVAAINGQCIREAHDALGDARGCEEALGVLLRRVVDRWRRQADVRRAVGAPGVFTRGLTEHEVARRRAAARELNTRCAHVLEAHANQVEHVLGVAAQHAQQAACKPTSRVCEFVCEAGGGLVCATHVEPLGAPSIAAINLHLAAVAGEGEPSRGAVAPHAGFVARALGRRRERERERVEVEPPVRTAVPILGQLPRGPVNPARVTLRIDGADVGLVEPEPRRT